MSKEITDDKISDKSDCTLNSKKNEMEAAGESSLLNSIVEAVMRGDMNQVVTLALSHRSSDQKVKTVVDQALSSAISTKAKLKEKTEDEALTENGETLSSNTIKSVEDIMLTEPVAKSPNTIKQYNQPSVTSESIIYSQRNQVKSNENKEVPCTYYFSNNSIISSNCSNNNSNGSTALYRQSDYSTQNAELENNPDDSLNNTLSQYQITNSALQNVESINTLGMSQQSVQVQLPGIGNFLLHIPSNFKPGEPIALPLNLPLTPVSQPSGVNPISIHMNAGQLMSNQLLSLYNPSSNINITAGKKMRAIAPKPSKPTYRQPLIAPKTSSPNTSINNQDGLNSSTLPAPSGPGRRKGNKSKKSGRKRGAPTKSHKNSSYASSTHSIDSQDACQYNENNTLKQSCNNSLNSRSTYQCNYYVNNDSSDYLNQSHVAITHSFNEINSNTLLDNSDSGEKDLLSLAWEISNAELSNTDDFTTAYNLYDAGNLGTDGFVSSEILDQFLQNIQKDDITELTRCPTTQINIDSRVSYASSFTTLPPCSTVLPSVTTSTYLNNYSNNSSNVEMPQCIEIAEVVNLNTEDMLTELEKEENAFLDKFVAQYSGSHQNEIIRCDSQSVIPVTTVECPITSKNNDSILKDISSNCHSNLIIEDSEKEIDLNIKESNELSEIAKQIEISCSSHQDSEATLKSKIYTMCENLDCQSKIDNFSKENDHISEANFSNNTSNTISFCTIPNTSIELIYSTNDSSLLDEKTQCLMSINFDSKRTNESSFYVTDSTLKSKTLDDFGLFEFCTDGEISLNMKTLNHESANTIIDDDNKYIEPPILEDISDATPIQSDNESEDEDIDELAFKFSKFNYCNSGLNKMKKIDLTEKLYFSEFIKTTSSFKNFQKHDLTPNESKNWYIGNDEIEIVDIFSKVNLRCDEHVLKDNPYYESKPIEDFHNLKKSSEEKCIDSSISLGNADDIICNIKLNDKTENDFNMLLVLESNIEKNDEKTILIGNQTNIICTKMNSDIIGNDEVFEDISTSLIEENIKDKIHQIITDELQIDCNLINETQKYKAKNTVCSTLKRQRRNKKSEKVMHAPKEFKADEIENMTDIPNDRQRRLRKPPKKLAIYQSINFIENKFSIPIDRKINSKRKVEFSEKPKLSTDFRRCTRSKGSISKSFDSFYEAISRHKITSTNKSKISQKNISKKEISANICSNDLSEEKSNDNVIDVNVTNNEHISCTDIDQLSDLQSQIDNSNTITNNDMAVRLSNTKIPLFQKTILKQFKSDYKKSNVIRKYNLRKNSVSSKRESDHFIEHNSYVKIQRNKNNTVKNISEINKRDILKSNMKLSQIKRRRKFDKPKFLQYNINNAMIKNNADEYESIDFHFAFFENKAIIIESVKDNFLYPTFNINVCQTANFVENKRCAYSHTSEFNDKKFYPVRKINRKLRIYSGLEANVKDDNIKFASLIDMNLNDFPCRFQCCSQFAKVIKPNNMLVNHSMCDQFIPDSYSATIEIQSFNNSDEPISDTDDIESLDAPLVIVEIDEVSDHSSHIKSKECSENLIESNLIENKDVSNIINQSNFLEKPIVKKQNEVSDIPKTYALRTKCRQNTNFVKRKEKIRRPLFNRLCKKSEIHHDIHIDNIDNDNDLINHIKLKTPICSIEKLSHNDIMANLNVSPNSVTINMLNNEEERDSNLEHSFRNNLKTSAIDVINSINLKVEKNVFKKLKGSILKKIRTKVNIYKIIKKSLWRKSVHKIFNNNLKSKSKIILNCYRNNLDKSNKNVKLLKDSITHLVLQSRDYNENRDNDDNESINVENDSPNDEFNTYLDSNNVETFSRNYGSFSLKIKVQKKDPNLLEQTNIKKHKKNSKKRKKLRHFLSSIIGSDDITYKMNSSEEYEKIAEFNNEIKRKNRKRKYSLNHDTVCSEVYNTNQDLRNYLNQEITHLTSESRSNDDSQYQKPIKIKLFKSTNEDLSKLEGSSLHSEKIVFSLQKSDNNKNEFGKTANQKILQIIQSMPSKPCRQAANLAKKKIFSTAKEDRRSQNATLTSIWNSKRSNNGINKGTSDILTIYQNDRGKRPRGRPPKLGQSLFTSEKQASSTGTLKLKIKLSKDFKNCNNDSHSSNGENSGRTSTNDSSILNSAVAGINGPSDALSLESNNFINGITEQLDQNIEYLEAKEAKVYFDPNQVDIEKIKNSFYSSKKINQESFSIELHQRLYENSVTNISNNKSDMSNNRNFSQYGDLESVDSNNLYNNILSKENLSNKLSHLSKDNMNISENCYSNLISNREPQNLSQNNQLFQFDNQLSSPERSSSDVWQNSKTNSSDSLTTCRNNSNSWFSEHRNIRDQSFPNSNSIIYNSYMTSPVKESKSCISQNQNPPFACENENSDSKLIQRSPSKRSASSEGRKSVSNSFSINESHNQLSPHYIRSGIGSVPSQLNIHPWSDDSNHNTSLNHTAAAWVTYAQQQAAAAAYMDPQMKAYYNLALSQSMLNNPYCGSYGNPAANSENFYSSLHSQYLNNSKESSEKINISNGGVRNHNDPMGTFMEAAQMSSWEHFYSAAAMAGYHNSSQGAMDEYAGRAGNMLQAHHMLANGYSGSMLGRDHFSIENNKPPLAHQNQSGSTSPIKLTAAGSTPVSSSQAYSHVQMPYSHFSGTTVGNLVLS